jgi:hypothetical protein
MKKITYLIIILAAAALGSCNSDLATEGISTVTFYPEFNLTGDPFYIIAEDEEWTDPGVEVTEGDTEIPYTATYTGRYTGYTGTVIGDDPDEYSLVYSAVNKDGFSGSDSRRLARVNTGDFVNSVAGAYSGTSVRAGGETYTDILILIVEVEPNVFEISCSLGGFYSDGRALGDAYLVLGGQISINDLSTGDFTYETDVLRADGTAMEVSEMEIDPATKTISFRTTTDEFANGDWQITLTQIQP